MSEDQLDAMERAWAADLSAEAAPAPGDAALLSALVEKTIASVPPPGPGAGAGASAGGTGATGSSKLVGIVAALGIAGAAGYALLRSDPTPPAPTAQALAPARAIEHRVEPPASAPPPPEQAVAAAEPAVPEATADTEVDAASEPARSGVARASTPDDLFSRANAARRARQYDAAIRLYQRLQKEHKGSREAQVSRVALGRLLLDERGQPGRALRLFDAYLDQEPRGSLAEEATAGRALALGELGNVREERGAWEQLLRRFPSSAYASRARQRLDATTP